MTRNVPFEWRAMPYDDWPKADRWAWEAAVRPGDIFDTNVGRGAHLADATKERYVGAWSRYLAFLVHRDWLDPHMGPAERMTPERAAAYIEALADRVTSRTVAGYLEAIHNTLFAMAPRRDWGWLRAVVNRLKRQVVPNRTRNGRLPPIDELFRAGIELMDRADRRKPKRPLQDSVWFRDGLMIAILAATLVRRRNLAALRLGIHLVRQSSAYLLTVPPNEVKNRQPIDGQLPERLTPYVDRYREHHRPRLLQGNATDALWITENGDSMSINSIGDRITKVTLRLLGVPVSPHMFRHSAATTIATKDPKHTMIIRSLLVHTTHQTAERYYNLALGMDAVNRYTMAIEQERKDSGPPPRGRRSVRGDATCAL